jgi:RNA polymerase sigma factor (sigma-70 family)
MRSVGDGASFREREILFVEAYPFARRSTQVRTAALTGNDVASPDPEDIAQEVLLQLWRSLGNYDSSRSSLRTYTETIVCSTISSVLRRCTAKKRRRGADFYSPIEVGELSIRIELRIDLRRAIQKLGRLDLQVARLLLRDYKPGEVARKLGTSRAAVYRSVGRIRVALERAGFR